MLRKFRNGVEISHSFKPKFTVLTPRRAIPWVAPVCDCSEGDIGLANVTVIGAQWGDEGKGKIVAWLARSGRPSSRSR